MSDVVQAIDRIDDAVRVIIVDDVKDAADTLSCLLELDGYRVWSASDGLEALTLIEQHAPHCVLLDVDMPGLDGQGLAERLRQRYGDDIVLIAVTGWDEDDERVATTFRLVDHYLKKPVEPAALRKVLRPA